MKILIACEFSGIVRDAFASYGHDVWSCDLLDTERPGNHIKANVLEILNEGWDMMVAHPPCTYLTISGNKWMKTKYRERFPTRVQDRKDAIMFFMELVYAPISRIAIENPVGIISTLFRKPDQYIQPFHFGESRRKKTGLWLKNLPKLEPTKIVEPELYTYKNGKTDPMWHVQSLKLPPEERAKARSRTFQGIANAMAKQWGMMD